jgi:Ni/Fe-hydrogenase subunit HybB-like protein
MVEHAIPATKAVVTLDVAIPGIVWGWIITMNMWAKSIGTGVIFLGYYLFKKYKKNEAILSLETPILLVSLVFIHIFLLFTVLDLHQMFRFWHIFVYPHWTSAITVGAWIVTALVGVLFIMLVLKLLKKSAESFYGIAVFLAIPVTLYTAGIMAEASARELWQMPTEMAQMVLAATLTGAGALILLGLMKKDFPKEAQRDLAIILGISALASFLLYMGELVFGPMKSEEVAATLVHIAQGGEYHSMFWIGQSLAYLIPMGIAYIAIKSDTYEILPFAAISAIVGLWIVKHVWLVIPQLVPMS